MQRVSLLHSQSSKSGDGVVGVGHFVCSVLVVDTLPLVVVIVLVIYGTVHDWLPHVHNEEQRHKGESKTHPVARETDVQIAIALVRSKRCPPSGVGRLH